MKITPREKRRHAAGREKNDFLAWDDFHARSRFARSTIPEAKWGTTRSLDHNLRLSTQTIPELMNPRLYPFSLKILESGMGLMAITTCTVAITPLKVKGAASVDSEVVDGMSQLMV